MIPFVFVPKPYPELQPYGALFAGCVAGTVATFGYQVSHLVCIDFISYKTKFMLDTRYPESRSSGRLKIQEGVRLSPGRDPYQNLVYQIP